MPAFVSPHSSPYARLVANVIEDGECWLGTEKSEASFGYKRSNWYVPGLRRIVHLQSHIVTWIASQVDVQTVDELWLYYAEFRASGLELGHECHEPACRRPSHLSPMTHVENCAQRSARRSARIGMPELADCEF